MIAFCVEDGRNAAVAVLNLGRTVPRLSRADSLSHSYFITGYGIYIAIFLWLYTVRYIWLYIYLYMITYIISHNTFICTYNNHMCICCRYTYRRGLYTYKFIYDHMYYIITDSKYIWATAWRSCNAHRATALGERFLWQKATSFREPTSLSNCGLRPLQQQDLITICSSDGLNFIFTGWYYQENSILRVLGCRLRGATTKVLDF